MEDGMPRHDDDQVTFGDLLVGEMFMVHLHADDAPTLWTKMGAGKACNSGHAAGIIQEIKLGKNGKKAPVTRVCSKELSYFINSNPELLESIS